MATGIIGKKLGMTRIFTEDGEAVPVTVMEVGPCVVTELRTMERDGYEAVRLGFGTAKEKRVAKPQRVDAEKKNIGLLKYNMEFRGMSVGEVGTVVDVSLFEENEMIATRSKTIGKGFQGVIKRHHHAAGPATHGASKFHRAPGSRGAGTTPGKIWKGMKSPGHMGNKFRTTKGLRVVKVDLDRNLLYIRGAVSGARGAIVKITKVGKA